MKKGTTEFKGTVNRGGATCVCCNESVRLDYVRTEGRSNRIAQVLIGMVIDTGRGKTYISPTKEQQIIALNVVPKWKPETNLPEKALGFRVQLYGMDMHWKLFSNRQLLGLSTLEAIIGEIKNKIIADGGVEDYAKAIQFFLLPQ